MADVPVLPVLLPVLPEGRGGIGLYGIGPDPFVLSLPVVAFMVGWVTELWWHTYTIWRALIVNVIAGIFLVSVSIPSSTLADRAPVATGPTLIAVVLAAFATVGIRRVYPRIEVRTDTTPASTGAEAAGIAAGIGQESSEIPPGPVTEFLLQVARFVVGVAILVGLVAFILSV